MAKQDSYEAYLSGKSVPAKPAPKPPAQQPSKTPLNNWHGTNELSGGGKLA